MNYIYDLLHRLRKSIGWIAAQFWALLLMILIGLAWTRLPDKYGLQVFLSLLIPLLLIAGFLFLQAGTMRRLVGRKEERSPFWTVMLMLLGWAIVIWVAWSILDRCDDQIPRWAGYLNSRASAGERAKIFTYAHLTHWFTIAEWILRWIAIPAKVIPHAVASAQWGWRLPWRRSLRVLLNWRWWPVPIAAALLGSMLPAHFFTAEPHGTVTHQVWMVVLKLGGAYLLGVVCWVLLLVWAAVLLTSPAKTAEDRDDDALHVVPIGSNPLRHNAVALPLPETGEGSGGNA